MLKIEQEEEVNDIDDIDVAIEIEEIEPNSNKKLGKTGKEANSSSSLLKVVANENIANSDLAATPTPSNPDQLLYPQLIDFLPREYQWSTHLTFWSTIDNDFWHTYGKAIANKNLWVSVGNLALAFALWLVWSVIVVYFNEIHDQNENVFSFSSWKSDMTSKEYKAALWLLPATAGLSGATLRLTNSFMIAVSGGRNTISQTSILLLIPMIMLSVALNNADTSLEYLISIALFTGVGGGAFASSMSNISFFYPKENQGFALGVNAGIGNLGVSLMQVLVPGVVAYQAFGSAAADSYIGKDNETVYLANAAIFWIPFLCIFIVLAWFFMNSLPQHQVKDTPRSLLAFYYLEFLGFVGAGLCVLILITTRDEMSKPGLDILQAFILWFLAVVIVVLCMKYLMFWKFVEDAKVKVDKQLGILSLKHTWIMTYLYTMTFGSFIGFSASFPKLIADVFGYLPNGDTNPNAPNPLAYAWLGPFVGSLIRPVGGWLSDKYGGARVTHWDVIVMIMSTFGVGGTLIVAKESQNPENIFPLFLVLFLILFITTGIGNGSTFRMVPIIFQSNPEQAGPVLGWTSAIAAYGAFFIPVIFGASITLGFPEWAMFGFAIYYVSCLGINWYFYYREDAPVPC